jgi:MFS family permease
VRTFTGAAFLATVFSIAFGAMLLSIVLWEQTAWGWSALATGAAIAPGPLMVPVFSFLVAGRAIERWGPGPVSAVGATAFALGVAWWAAAATVSPDYVTGILPGMLLSGVGVGLTLPTYMATAAASLPAPSFATGSAVVNMLRQIGLAIGVALLVAVLGSAVSAQDRLHAFQRGWLVIAGLSLASAIVGGAALPGRTRAAAGERSGPPAVAVESE